MGADLLTSKISSCQWRDLTRNAIYKLTQSANAHHRSKADIVGRIFKTLVFLILVGICAVIGFAYLGDLQPDRVEVNQPIELNVD
jgi:hypothetical protein